MFLLIECVCNRSRQQAGSASSESAGKDSSIFGGVDVDRAVQVARNFADGSGRPE